MLMDLNCSNLETDWPRDITNYEEGALFSMYLYTNANVITVCNEVYVNFYAMNTLKK